MALSKLEPKGVLWQGWQPTLQSQGAAAAILNYKYTTVPGGTAQGWHSHVLLSIFSTTPTAPSILSKLTICPPPTTTVKAVVP